MAKARPITGLDPQAPTAQNACMIVRARLKDMYAYKECIESPANIRELHDLRIATKRVRYTLEVFSDFLPEAGKVFAEELAALQEELGALHDSEVTLALLRLILQQEQTVLEVKNTEETRSSKKQALLSADMIDTLLNAERYSALTATGRRGLMSFLHRQEQRREESYALFRRHWDQLEQRHFREEILQMLDHVHISEETGNGRFSGEKRNS